MYKAHVEAEILAIAKPKKAEALLKAQKDEENASAGRTTHQGGATTTDTGRDR